MVEGPTEFDANGVPIATGQVLITIDTTTGEAEAAGRNLQNQADYRISEIEAEAVTTIV